MKANSSNILVLFQIKRLLKERADQDKLFSNKDEELKKLEGRLHNATSEKSSLQAKLAAAEKELQAAKKSNELLKHKVEDSFHTYMYLYRDYGKNGLTSLLYIRVTLMGTNQWRKHYTLYRIYVKSLKFYICHTIFTLLHV